MKLPVKIFVLLIGYLAFSPFNFLSAQSVLNPADPVITYDPTAPPTQPAFGQIGKWVRTKRLNWNTDSYKAYIYKGLVFRLKFPTTYNHTANDGKKYPMLVFFHGLGEKGPITDNEYQLYHGGQQFNTAVNNGTYDGYVLAMQSQGFWGMEHYIAVSELIDYMITNNKLDPFQVSVNGLSAGGQGTWEMTLNYPTYISAALPMSSVSTLYESQTNLNKFKYIPVWLFQGALDGAPAAFTARNVVKTITDAGGNIKYTEYANVGHGTWFNAWAEPDFWPFIKRGYAANPWPLYGRKEFCPNEPINAVLGLTSGYEACEWRRNGNLIAGATTHTYTATQTGIYTARVRRNGVWSEWSRTPVEVKIKTPTVSPTITKVLSLSSSVLPALDGSTSITLRVPEGYSTYDWQKMGVDTTISDTSIVTVSAPGNYRVKVTEQFGCSSDFSTPFTVIDANGPGKPDAASNLIANALSQTTIRLDWSENPTPQFNETNYEVYQSVQPGGPYKFIAIVGQNITTYTQTNLNPNTLYYFRVRAINLTGASAGSNEANAKTIVDSKAPTAPKNLAATSSTRYSVSLNWEKSTDDVGVTKYEVYVNGLKSYYTTDTSFVVSGLISSQSYNFTVRAVDFAGNASPFSNQVTGQTILKGLNYKYYTFTGSWSNLPNFNSLIPNVTGTMANVAITPRTQDDRFAFLWEGFIIIPQNGSYRFRTTSDDGSRMWLGALNGTTSPYSFSGTPTINNDGLHGDVTVTSASLNLTAGVYPVAIAFFEQTGGQSMSFQWSFNSGTFVNVPNSAFAEAPLAGTIPSKPGNLAATPVSFKQINLTWTDNSSNELGFEIWRSTNAFSNFTTIAQVAANVTTYSDTALSPNTRYYYRIRALGQFGESDYDLAGQGVDYDYYEQNNLTVLPNFGSLTAVKSGRVTNFGLGMQNRSDHFQLKFSGIINIPANGIYTFFTTSDAGSKLYIDGFAPANQVVNNDGVHTSQERSGSIYLTKGPHSIFVTYFETTNTEVLSVRMSGPGLTKQLIPDAFLGTPFASATTLAPSIAPAYPNNLTATAVSKTAVQINWTDRSNNEEKFELYRSSNNNSDYFLYKTLPANTNSFSDTGLFANAVFYYKVRAVNNGGNSIYTNEDSSKTFNTKPVIVDIPDRSARYGATTVIQVKSSDADADPLVYTTTGLPAFASFVDNGNTTATLTLNPLLANQGVYPGIRIIVSDAHGGQDTTEFTLTVNNNYEPVINAISNYTIAEKASINIPLSATDQNAGDVLTWSVENLPNTFTLTPGANGAATLMLNPGYDAAGTYTVDVKVNDGNGGIATSQFTLTVTDKNPSRNIYVRFRNTTNIGTPWNSITSSSASNLKDEADVNTGFGLTFPLFNGFYVRSDGPQTGNNSGVFPDAVLRDQFYFGTFWTAQTGLARLTGLNPNKRYKITFYAGTVWDYSPDHGNTEYTVNGRTVSLYVQNNTRNTVALSDLEPDANGVLDINMAKASNALAGFLNAFILTELYEDGTAPKAPEALTAENRHGIGVSLNWTDKSYNEGNFEIYRATSQAGPYTLIGYATADEQSFMDKTAVGNTLVYYRVRAVNRNGSSDYSNVVSIISPNQIPQIKKINNVTLKNNESLSINVLATDDANDQLRLSVSGLPIFATFTDNGDGTGVINIQPNTGSVGIYSGIVATVRDNSDSSRSTSFSITVTDKDVSSVFLNFTDGSSFAERPWNNIAGWPSAGSNFTNIFDEAGNPAGMTVNFPDGFQGAAASGMRANTGREIYPDIILRTGEYEGTNNTRRIVVSGLDTSKRYNFVFFASRDDGFNYTTNYSITSQSVTQTVTLNASYNINKTVQINGVAPNAGGQVTINISKANGADFAIISSLIIVRPFLFWVQQAW
jgi:large repetitive protein